MRLYHRLWIVSITILTAIASQLAIASYQSDDVVGGFRTGGYADTRINGNTAVVYFDGTRYDSPDAVRKYLLFRCAQVTIENGYDYFIITSTNTGRYNLKIHTKQTEHYVSTRPKMVDQYYTTTEFESASEVKSKVYQRPSLCAPPQHGASAVIKMFNGDVPDNVASAYDAQDVIGHLAPDTF